MASPLEAIRRELARGLTASAGNGITTTTPAGDGPNPAKEAY